MTAIFDEFQNLVLSRPHYRANDYINISCPACGDRRKRGGFVPSVTGGFRYNCFNGGCEYNQPTGWEPGNGLVGRIRRLFEQLGGSVGNLPLADLVPTNHINGTKAGEAPVRHDVAVKFPDVSMPEGTMFLDEALASDARAEPIFDYLVQRSPMFVETNYPFMWTPKHPNHLMVPYLHFDGQIVGYMGRKVTATKGADRFLQRAAPNYMFNQYLLKGRSSKYVFVMESPLDAILMRGIATRENRLTQKQINLLGMTASTPVLIPDRKITEAEPYFKAAQDNDWPVAVPDWPYKDVGDAVQKMGLLNAVSAITSSITTNYTLARVTLGRGTA